MTSRSPRLLSLCVLLSAIALSVCSTARADRKEDAAAAAQRGDHAFGKSDFAGALTEYRASYEKYPKPYLLFRIGECQRSLGQDADALDTYKKYLAKVSHGADRKKAEVAAAGLQAKVDQAAADAQAKADEAAAAAAKAQPVAQSNDSEAPPLDDKAVAAAKSKKVQTESQITTASAPKADVLPPAFDPTAPPEPSPRDEPLPPGEKLPIYKRWWPWAIVAGAVVVGVSVGLGVGLGIPKFHSELPVGGPGAIAMKALTVHF